MKKRYLDKKGSEYVKVIVLENISGKFIFPIYARFLESSGVTKTEMNFLNAVYHLLYAIFDPITGYLGDRFGHLKIFALGLFLETVGVFIYGLSSIKAGFLVAEIVAAFGGALKSEALEARLKNHMNEKYGKENGDLIFPKVKSHAALVGTLLGLIGVILGGLIVWSSGNFSVLWIISGCVNIFTLVMILDFSSNGKAKSAKLEVQINALVSSKAFFRNPKLRGLAMFKFTQAVGFQALNMFWTLVLVDTFKGYPQSELFIMGFALMVSLSIGLGEWFAKRFALSLKSISIVTIVLGITILLPSLTGVSLAMSLGFLVHDFFRGTMKQLSHSFSQKFLSDHERATHSSFLSSAGTLGGTVGLLGSGYLGDVFDIRMTWILSGVLILFSSLFLIAWKRRRLF